MYKLHPKIKILSPYIFSLRFLFLISIFITAPSFAQSNYKVHGMVTNPYGRSMSGVTVTQKGTQNKTQTDTNGHFVIEINDNNSSLQFSYIGFQQKEEKYSNADAASIIVVSLTPSISLLKEVIVTGYQTLDRSTSTGAITKIDEKTLNENINTNLSSALEGRVAGLMFQKNPFGAAADKPILRGIGTFLLCRWATARFW